MKNIIFILCFCLNSFAINSQSYFKTTYEEAKKDFLSRGLTLHEESKDKDHPSTTFLSKTTYKNFDGNDYEMNYLYLPAQEAKSLVIIQSGTHGIEGHAGSGVQNFIIDYLQIKKPKQTSFLFIHGVNQYGFANNRRVNFNNVDLNRNFHFEKSEFKSENPGYDQVNHFLNPADKLEINFFSKLFFHFDSVKLIIKHSKDTLKRAILKGQYNTPKGIYFGGADYQPEFFALNDIWDKFIPSYKKVLFIDIHTGYGEKNKLHLLANSSKSKDAEELKNIFKPRQIDFGDDKEFYQVKGDITSYFHQKYSKDKNIYALAFEYGTLDSQKLLGSIDSLYRMIAENKGFNNGYNKDSDKKEMQTLFSDMFYPKDFTWRDKVLDQTKEELDSILTYFENN